MRFLVLLQIKISFFTLMLTGHSHCRILVMIKQSIELNFVYI